MYYFNQALALNFDLKANGHKVMVVTPLYGHYSDAWDTGFWAEVIFKFVSAFPCSCCYLFLLFV